MSSWLFDIRAWADTLVRSILVVGVLAIAFLVMTHCNGQQVLVISEEGARNVRGK